MTRQQRMRVELPAIIALGGNLGDREATIRAAVAAIGRLPGVKIVAASGLVESAAVTPDGIDETAPAYLNAVIRVRTSLDPEALLAALHGIEADLGRERIVHWGDRTIDLDLISHAGSMRETETLTLPHPRAWQRAFVLEPWLEIQPDARLPGRGLIADLARAATDTVSPFSAAPLLARPPGAEALR